MDGDIAEALCGEESSGEGSEGDVKGGLGTMVGDHSGAYRALSTKNDKVWTRSNPDSARLMSETNPSNYEKVKTGLRSNVNVMKNKLKRALIAKQQRDFDFGKESGRLDTKRLVKATTGSPYVFKTRIDREEMDTVVYVLGDLSGSMCGEKAKVLEESCIALSECFEGTQIVYKVAGFCNKRGSPRSVDGRGKFHRYEALDTYVFKDYSESLRTARGSMGNIENAVGGNNSDYDFITNAINELKKRPEKRKVLFVLSDGCPSCRSDASTGEHIKHCKQAILEGTRQGVECVGVGILDSSVKRIYKDCVVVKSVDELSGTVFTKFTNLLLKG